MIIWVKVAILSTQTNLAILWTLSSTRFLPAELSLIGCFFFQQTNSLRNTLKNQRLVQTKVPEITFSPPSRYLIWFINWSCNLAITCLLVMLFTFSPLFCSGALKMEKPRIALKLVQKQEQGPRWLSWFPQFVSLNNFQRQLFNFLSFPPFNNHPPYLWLPREKKTNRNVLTDFQSSL